jgi:hypothetical protein
VTPLDLEATSHDLPKVTVSKRETDMLARPAKVPVHRHPKSRASIFIMALAIAALLSSCGSSGTHGATVGTGSNSSSTTSGQASTTTTTYYPQGHLVAPPSTPTTLPGETANIPVSSYISAGNTILIKSNAFWPHTLYANDQVAITWVNLSGRPQKVAFDHIPVGSQVIPPGWEFVWKSRFGGSLTYHSASGLHALLVLQDPTPVTPPTTAAP